MKKIVSILLMALVVSYSSFGQLSSDTVLLSGRIAKDMLDDFDSAANRLMQKAQATGNNVAAQFGNKILVASENVNTYLNKKTDKVFDKLKPGEQQLFVEVNKIIQQFNKTDQTVAVISEMTNLDLTDFTRRLNVLPRADYYIRFINGTTIINSTEPFVLSISGAGFSLTDNRKKNSTVVYINDTPLPSAAVDITQGSQMQLSIPDSLVKPFFKDDQIVYVPVKIVAKITIPLGAFDMNTKNETCETRFNLILMPSIAGEISITENITHKNLEDRTLTRLISRSFQGCKTKDSCEMSESWRCSADQKIIGVRYQCGGQCDLSFKKRATTPGDKYAPDFDILNDGRSVAVYRHLEVEKPTTITYFIDYKNYKEDSETVKNSTIKLKYGEPFDVLLNAGNPDNNYSIVGKLKTGQVIDYNNNTILSSAYLKVLSIDNSGDKHKITFKLTPVQ